MSNSGDAEVYAEMVAPGGFEPVTIFKTHILETRKLVLVHVSGHDTDTALMGSSGIVAKQRDEGDEQHDKIAYRQQDQMYPGNVRIP